jgi:hypothetical protein
MMYDQFKETVHQKPGHELLKMVYQFDQWSPEMLQAVETELAERKMLPDDIAAKKQQAVMEEERNLERGKPASVMGQVFGWLLVLGFVGLYIGYTYMSSKVRSKYTGKKYYKYNADSRDNGSYIFYTSIAALILGFFYAVYKYS